MEVKRIRTGSLTSLERSDLHVMDDTSRIAIVNHWTVDSYLREVDSSSELNQNKIRYQYSNHLGSASLELNSTGQIISYEEYFPYGGTSFTTGQSQKEVKLKKYRYIGKERDDATGLYYYGARYYASWLGRWLSCDPSLNDGWNLYVYVRNNPIRLVDDSGRSGGDFNQKILSQVKEQGMVQQDHARVTIQTIEAQQTKLPEQQVLGMLNGKGVIMPEGEYFRAKNSEFINAQMDQLMNPLGAIGYIGASAFTDDPNKRLLASQVGSFAFGVMSIAGPAAARNQQKSEMRSMETPSYNEFETARSTSTTPSRNTIGVGQYTDKSGRTRNSNGQYGIRGIPKAVAEKKKSKTPATNPSGLTTKEVGAIGESSIRKVLEKNGWEIITPIKNNSDNGIDLIARGRDGQLGFFEVKTTATQRETHGLSGRQQNMADFVMGVLTNAKSGKFPYSNITNDQRILAGEHIKEIKSGTTPVTGAVFGVNLNTGVITVSRWGRE